MTKKEILESIINNNGRCVYREDDEETDCIYYGKAKKLCNGISSCPLFRVELKD